MVKKTSGLNIPSCLPIESAYIGKLLHGELPDKRVTPDDFYGENNRIIISHIEKLPKRNKGEVRIMEVKSSLEASGELEKIGGNKALISLGDEAMGSPSMETMADLILSSKKRRDLIRTANSLMNGAYDESEKIESVLSEAYSSIGKISNDIVGDSVTCATIDSMWDDYTEHLRTMEGKAISGYSSGFKIIDENCDGLQPGTVMRLNAYSNVGKTRLAIQILVNLLKQGIPCVFFSTEVTRRHFIMMIASSYFQVDYADVKTGKVQLDFSEFSKLPLKFYDSVFDLKGIKLISEKHIMEDKTKVIMVDFCQNIDAGFFSDEYKNMTVYARDIQKFAIQNNVAILDLSQVSNEGAKAGAASSIINSKGSGALVASADVGLLLTRKEFAGGAMNLNLAIKKNKYGPRVDIDLDVDFATSKFIESAFN